MYDKSMLRWGERLIALSTTMGVIGREGKETGGNKNNTATETTAILGAKCPQDQLHKTLCPAVYWFYHCFYWHEAS